MFFNKTMELHKLPHKTVFLVHKLNMAKDLCIKSVIHGYHKYSFKFDPIPGLTNCQTSIIQI